MWEYETDLTWKPGTEVADVACGTKPVLKIMPPPEFGGDADVWSPEDLMVAAIQSCTLLTLLFWTKQYKVEMLGHTSKAKAVMERTKDGLRFTRAEIEYDIWIASEDDKDKLSRAVEKVNTACPVKAAIDVPYTIKLNTHVGEPSAV